MDYVTKSVMVEQYLNAINTRDIDCLENLFSDDVVIEDPVGSIPHLGKDAALLFYTNTVFESGALIKQTGPIRANSDYAVIPAQVCLGTITIDVIEKFVFYDGYIKSMQAFFGDDNFATGN